MNIIGAIKHPELFRPFLADRHDSLRTWGRWLCALRALYGLPLTTRKQRRLIREITGREPQLLPEDGFSSALFLTGRRSGKSRIAAVIGAYEAVLGGHEEKLSPGEQGIVAILAPTKKQSQIVKSYIRAIFSTEMLHGEVVKETREGFELRNGVLISVLTGDWRLVRGFTLLAAIIDELAFFGLDEESKVRSDTELVRAIKPALATVGGKLIGITTPYARKGYTWQTFQRHHGNDEGKTLVVNCTSRTLNPTLPQAVVDEAMAEDPAAASSEYGGQFRDDVSGFVDRVLVESLVVPGRIELPPRLSANPPIRYNAFCDLSGGRRDDAALAIGHRERPDWNNGRTVVLDKLLRWRPPFNPHAVIGDMVIELRRWGLRRIMGDNYAAAFVAEAFESRGIQYRRCEKPKSELYRELLPRMTSAEVELLDDETLIAQIAGLERRVRSGGRDVIDHPPGGHDDVANAAAGVIEMCVGRVLHLGVKGIVDTERRDRNDRIAFANAFGLEEA